MGQSKSKPKSKDTQLKAAAGASVAAVVAPIASKSSEAPKLQENTLTRKLADVELQLIMHGLEVQEIMQFAQCNHQLMQTAGVAFPWKHSLLQVKATADNLSSVNCSQLLRHSPLSIFFSGEFELNSAAFLNLTIWSRVREIHVDGLTFHSSEFLSLLAHPELQKSLEVMQDHGQTFRVVDEQKHLESLRLLAACPKLHTFVTTSRSEEANGWAMLENAPALTSLAITDWTMESRLLPSLCRFPHLSHLVINGPRMSDGSFPAFCTSPLIRQHLQFLAFEGFIPAGDSLIGVDPMKVDDLITGFTALKSLHSFRLGEMNKHNSLMLLPLLVHAPALTSLTLASLPSFECLRDLLTAVPRLHLTVVRESYEDQPSEITRDLMNCPQFKGRIHAQQQKDDVTSLDWLRSK